MRHNASPRCAVSIYQVWIPRSYNIGGLSGQGFRAQMGGRTECSSTPTVLHPTPPWMLYPHPGGCNPPWRLYPTLFSILETLQLILSFFPHIYLLLISIDNLPCKLYFSNSRSKTNLTLQTC